MTIDPKSANFSRTVATFRAAARRVGTKRRITPITITVSRTEGPYSLPRRGRGVDLANFSRTIAKVMTVEHVAVTCIRRACGDDMVRLPIVS